jgi:hypothetical protein
LKGKYDEFSNLANTMFQKILTGNVFVAEGLTELQISIQKLLSLNQTTPILRNGTTTKFSSGPRKVGAQFAILIMIMTVTVGFIGGKKWYMLKHK